MYQFEHIVTQNGAVSPPISSSITPAPGGSLPATVLVRARSDGQKVIGEFSVDNGDSWSLIGHEGHAAPLTGALRVGPVAFRGSQGGGTAAFDWVRLLAGAQPGGPVECGTGCSPLSDQFNGTTLDPKWAVVNPVPGSTPTVSGGSLKLPLVPGDLYGDRGNAQMMLQQSLAGSWVATAKIKHANVDLDGEAAGLALINSLNPNHFVKTGLQFKSDTDPDTAGDQPGKWAERVADLRRQTPSRSRRPPCRGRTRVRSPSRVTTSGCASSTTPAANQVTTWTSTNGTTFASFGAPISVTQYLGQPGGFRIGLFGKHDGSGDDVVDVDAFNFVGRHRRPADPGRRLRRCGRSLPAGRRVRRHRARREVAGRQPARRPTWPSAAAT